MKNLKWTNVSATFQRILLLKENTESNLTTFLNNLPDESNLTTFLNNLPDENYNKSFHLNHKNYNEVYKIITNLKNYCSSGYEKIPVQYLKSAAEYIILTMAEIINILIDQ